MEMQLLRFKTTAHRQVVLNTSEFLRATEQPSTRNICIYYKSNGNEHYQVNVSMDTFMNRIEEQALEPVIYINIGTDAGSTKHSHGCFDIINESVDSCSTTIHGKRKQVIITDKDGTSESVYLDDIARVGKSPEVPGMVDIVEFAGKDDIKSIHVNNYEFFVMSLRVLRDNAAVLNLTRDASGLCALVLEANSQFAPGESPIYRIYVESEQEITVEPWGEPLQSWVINEQDGIVDTDFNAKDKRLILVNEVGSIQHLVNIQHIYQIQRHADGIVRIMTFGSDHLSAYIPKINPFIIKLKQLPNDNAFSDLTVSPSGVCELITRNGWEENENE